MSYVRLHVITLDGRVCEWARASNALAFAPVIWSYLAIKHLCFCATDPMLLPLAEAPKVWQLLESNDLSPHERALLWASQDRIWMRKECLPLLVEALDLITSEYVVPRGITKTMSVIAEEIRRIPINEPDMIGIAIDTTSVNRSWWKKQIPLGKDGKPLVGNGLPSDYSYEALNVLKDPFCSDGERHECISMVDLQRI